MSGPSTSGAAGHHGTLRVVAPGRVNLIGDHVDYMGGPVLPMAIDLATTIDGTPGGDRIELTSAEEDRPASVPLPCGDPAALEPPWARYVAAVAAELGATTGITGTVHSTLPVGAGLSSSAALEVAVALALGAEPEPVALAQLCQRAEHAAVGVPSGIMDQLAVAAGRAGHAMLIDCATPAVEYVPVPDDVAVWVVHSGQQRTLEGSAYSERRAAAEAAAALLGPLPSAGIDDIEALDDPVLRRRARHVRTECDRVGAMASALATGDPATAGRLMVESHESLRDDYEVSTPVLDRLVEQLCATDGVFGARLTGAGFGGCVVALATPEADVDGWRVRPSDGAHRVGIG